MGHGAGLAKGFVIVALVIFGIVAIFGGLAIGLGALFHHPAAYAGFGALGTLGGCYLFYQTRRTCLIGGVSGATGGIAAYFSAVAIGGILGTLASLAVGAVATFVVLFVLLASTKQKGNKESWRKSKSSK